MENANVLDFADGIFEEMHKLDIGMSIANAQLKYRSIFAQKVSEDYIKSLLMQDERFIFINNNYFLLRRTFNDIKDKYGNNIMEMEKFIKDKYFIKDIDRKILIGNGQASEVGEYDTMILKFNDKVYEISNEDDFQAAIIKEGVITYSAMKAVSNYLGKEYYPFAAELEDIGVNINSENKIGRKCVAYKRASISKPKNIDNGENILLVDLRTNEIVACLTIIYLFKKCYGDININYFSSRHLSGLFTLNIIDNYNKKENINLTVYGERVIKDYKKFIDSTRLKSKIIDEFKKCKSSKELAKSRTIKKLDCIEFWETVSESFKQIYLSNKYSRTFIDLVGEANDNEIENLGDIILFHIDRGRYEEVKKVFIGKNATSGNKPIRNKTDICFRCRGFRCSKRMNVSKNKLLYYRSYYVDNIIKEIEDDANNLDILMKDPLIIKFVVPYLLCSRTKGLLIAIDCIEKNKVFLKESGIYCPFYDLWVINNDILV